MSKDSIMNIMNYDVFVNHLDNLELNEKQIVNTLNPHSYITAKNDSYFQKALKDSDILLPDGSGIVLAAKYIYGQKITKVAGSDLHRFLLEKMDVVSGKVFYMGASENTLNKIRERIEVEYPNIEVATYAPPYRHTFSAEESEVILSQVNAFAPDVLFIGMTAPKQEKWLYENKDKLAFTTASCIGAVFDFYAGNVQRSSQFWIDMHLEWLPRLLKEPRRLWRRNFVSTPLFLFDVIRYKFRFKR